MKNSKRMKVSKSGVVTLELRSFMAEYNADVNGDVLLTPSMDPDDLPQWDELTALFGEFRIVRTEFQLIANPNYTGIFVTGFQNASEGAPSGTGTLGADTVVSQDPNYKFFICGDIRTKKHVLSTPNEEWKQLVDPTSAYFDDETAQELVIWGTGFGASNQRVIACIRKQVIQFRRMKSAL